jgi:hypothetical protein
LNGRDRHVGHSGMSVSVRRENCAAGAVSMAQQVAALAMN